jgi:hypothetical protein
MDNAIKASNYGEVLAQINDLELVSYEEDGGYQGGYLAVLKDDDRLFYFMGSYGSCSGCDWLEDVSDWKTGLISYEEARNYCADIKPKYIVPLDKPLEFTSEEYNGFKLEPNAL